MNDVFERNIGNICFAVLARLEWAAFCACFVLFFFWGVGDYIYLFGRMIPTERKMISLSIFSRVWWEDSVGWVDGRGNSWRWRIGDIHSDSPELK